MIRVIRFKEADRQYDAVVTILAKDLTRYMVVAGMSLDRGALRPRLIPRPGDFTLQILRYGIARG